MDLTWIGRGGADCSLCRNKTTPFEVATLTDAGGWSPAPFLGLTDSMAKRRKGKLRAAGRAACCVEVVYCTWAARAVHEAGSMKIVKPMYLGEGGGGGGVDGAKAHADYCMGLELCMRAGHPVR